MVHVAHCHGCLNTELQRFAFVLNEHCSSDSDSAGLEGINIARLLIRVCASVDRYEIGYLSGADIVCSTFPRNKD